MKVIDPHDIDPEDYPKGPNGGHLFLIEWDGDDGQLYGSQVEANSIEEAEAQLEPGQRLLGMLALSVDVDEEGGEA